MNAKLAPVGNRVLFENDSIRVWLVDVAAGGELALHLHEDPYLLVNLTDGVLEVHDATGAPVERTLTGETVEWHEAGELHSFTNIGPNRYKNILVEVIGAAATGEGA
ncbi:hypothetical protein WEH80_08275 [Actinomycetes bacterium KLBMP 9759]